MSWECENAETRHIWRNLARNATQDEEEEEKEEGKSSFFFSRFLHSHVICRLPANYLAIILEKISGRRAGGAAREGLGRSPELATTKLATSNSQSAL